MALVLWWCHSHAVLGSEGSAAAILQLRKQLKRAHVSWAGSRGVLKGAEKISEGLGGPLLRCKSHCQCQYPKCQSGLGF